MDDEIEAGGLRCSEVLMMLGDVVDGTLQDPAASAVRSHLAACDRCARFGGAIAALVAQLRNGEPPPLDDDIAQRLDARLAAR
jgi:anti-sigma factor RsiW